MRGYYTIDRQLYMGKSVEGMSRLLLRFMLSAKRGRRHFYCLIFPAQADSVQLEIQHNIFLKNEYYRRHPVHVIGVASTLEEAGNLLVRISDEAVAAGMPGDLKGYLTKRCG